MQAAFYILFFFFVFFIFFIVLWQFKTNQLNKQLQKNKKINFFASFGLTQLKQKGTKINKCPFFVCLKFILPLALDTKIYVHVSWIRETNSKLKKK